MTEQALNLAPVESPCIDICRLDERGYCVGCWRTGQEIADWLSMAPDQRRAIMEALPARAESLFESR